MFNTKMKDVYACLHVWGLLSAYLVCFQCILPQKLSMLKFQLRLLCVLGEDFQEGTQVSHKIFAFIQ